MRTYEEMVEYIDSIQKFTSKNDSAHTRKLMTFLGNPHRRFEIIHVAGSNGKGSVCSMIANGLLLSQKRTGLFTSPHLTVIEERFRINGKNCERAQFAEAFEQVMEAVEKLKAEGLAHPSYFEFLFAMGMCIFAAEKVEYAVIETGLGGRLDATNVVEDPYLTVITSISLEHTQYLGSTIEEIAAEKAGIIKEGCGVVFDGSNETAARVIKQQAVKMHAPFYEVQPSQCRVLHQDGKKIDFSYQCRYDVSVTVQVPMPAEYQVMNAALAYKALELLQSENGISRETILEGIRTCRWQGRMQETEEDVYLDGAHNPDGIRAFLKTVDQIGGDAPVLLFSMVSDKDHDTAVKLLAGRKWDRVILTRISGDRSMDEDVLAEEFCRYGQKDIVCIPDAKEAYAHAKKLRSKGQKLFCAGSLYLIGELLQNVE